MFNPLAAPRWKTTISFFLFGIGVAATARCRNAGIVLMPIMATPPLFRKIRRETFIVVLLLPRWLCPASSGAGFFAHRQDIRAIGENPSPLKGGATTRTS